MISFTILRRATLNAQCADQRAVAIRFIFMLRVLSRADQIGDLCTVTVHNLLEHAVRTGEPLCPGPVGDAETLMKMRGDRIA